MATRLNLGALTEALREPTLSEAVIEQEEPQSDPELIVEEELVEVEVEPEPEPEPTPKAKRRRPAPKAPKLKPTEGFKDQAVVAAEEIAATSKEHMGRLSVSTAGHCRMLLLNQGVPADVLESVGRHVLVESVAVLSLLDFDATLVLEQMALTPQVRKVVEAAVDREDPRAATATDVARLVHQVHQALGVNPEKLSNKGLSGVTISKRLNDLDQATERLEWMMGTLYADRINDRALRRATELTADYDPTGNPVVAAIREKVRDQVARWRQRESARNHRT